MFITVDTRMTDRRVGDLRILPLIRIDELVVAQLDGSVHLKGHAQRLLIDELVHNALCHVSITVSCHRSRQKTSLLPFAADSLIERNKRSILRKFKICRAARLLEKRALGRNGSAPKKSSDVTRLLQYRRYKRSSGRPVEISLHETKMCENDREI